MYDADSFARCRYLLPKRIAPDGADALAGSETNPGDALAGSETPLPGNEGRHLLPGDPSGMEAMAALLGRVQRMADTYVGAGCGVHVSGFSGFGVHMSGFRVNWRCGAK